jgi:hypothetical protein
MAVSVRGGRDQLVIEVAANERHEGTAGRVNPANRQPSHDFGDLWVIAGQNFELQLVCGLDSEAGILLSEPCRLRLTVAVDAEQNDRCRGTRGRRGMLRSCGHDDRSWNQKGTRNGSLGFHGYGSPGSGLMSAKPSWHVTQLVRR